MNNFDKNFSSINDPTDKSYSQMKTLKELNSTLIDNKVSNVANNDNNNKVSNVVNNNKVSNVVNNNKVSNVVNNKVSNMVNDDNKLLNVVNDNKVSNVVNNNKVSNVVNDDKLIGKKREDFWFNDISVFFDINNLLKFFPKSNMNLAEKLNAICRLSLYIGISLFLLTEKIIYILLIVLVFIATYFIYFNRKDIVEKLTNEDIFRKPTKNNPMMNYNIITCKDKDKKAMPIINKEVSEEVKDNLRKNDLIDDKLYKSTHDLFDKNNSQRQFYTMPSTSMPNDQNAFAKWCYSTGPTCKERNLYCAPNFISLNNKHDN